MSRQVIGGLKPLKFKDHDLTEWLTSWEDSREPAFAVHKYLKRAGGEQEHMGREPWRGKFNLVFLHARGRNALLSFLADVEKEPKGQLIHPIFGTMRAAYRGYTGAKIDLAQAYNEIPVPVTFEEDAVDAKIDAQIAQGPAAKEAAVNTAASTMTAKVAPFAGATALASTLAAKATGFAAASVSATRLGVPDPSLPGQLAQVRTYTEATRNAVLSDTSSTLPSASRYEAMVAVERVYAACTALDDAVRAQKPVLEPYTVKARVHILTLAARFYGGRDAIDRASEIQANNPGRIPDPGNIKPGTVLLMATPTVAGARD